MAKRLTEWRWHESAGGGQAKTRQRRSALVSGMGSVTGTWWAAAAVRHQRSSAQRNRISDVARLTSKETFRASARCALPPWRVICAPRFLSPRCVVFAPAHLCWIAYAPYCAWMIFSRVGFVAWAPRAPFPAALHVFAVARCAHGLWQGVAGQQTSGSMMIERHNNCWAPRGGIAEPAGQQRRAINGGWRCGRKGGSGRTPRGSLAETRQHRHRGEYGRINMT